nr:PREDICTED: proteolipid protein 2 [Latimeria chalumnae]|eukprot:XP_014349651.1 PREDICTED: proteolipid protein 2 [Latimeria chalumnae]
MRFFLKVLCLIILICYVASRYGGYSAVAICEMVFAIIFFVVFAWEFDKTFRIIHWPWSVCIYLFKLCCSLSVLLQVLGIIAGILFGYDAYTILPTLRKTQHTAAPTGMYVLMGRVLSRVHSAAFWGGQRSPF